MDEYEVIDTGDIGVKKRIINDGFFRIVPKANPGECFSITNKSLLRDATVGFDSFKNELHQYFYIKYYEKHDFYTIEALNSHLLLGVEKKEDSQYDGSNVCQNSRNPNYLTRWNISSDNGFIFELKDFDFCLQYIPKMQLRLAPKKSNIRTQKFMIYTRQTIPNGIYYIRSMIPKKLFVTFNTNVDNDKNNSYLCSKDSKKDQLFYIVFDKYDGCYSMINIHNIKCINPGNNSLITAKINQSDFYNLDYQKWFIGEYDKKNIFIMHKQTGLLLCNHTKDTSNKSELRLKYFSDSDTNLNHFYQLISTDSASLLAKTISIIGFSKNKLVQEAFKKVFDFMQFRYLAKITSTFYINRQNYINCHFFENSFNLRYLEIPLSVINIHEKAFSNCFQIKFIKCDPKWLKLLPNPMNVENVIVPNGIQYIHSDHFKNFCNLKHLSLPNTLKLENCDKDSFSGIYNLKLYDGNPIFLKIIPKDELEIISIPSFVKTIPEKSYANCKILKEVIIGKDSHLKTIESKAFENCKLLRNITIPSDVESIAPDAFIGCNKDFKLKSLTEAQKSSMVDKLVIDQRVTEITDYIKPYINITSIDIHLGVQNCRNNILQSFANLKNVKCHPKWLNDFDTNKIETVIIPNQITELKKQFFEKLNHLKFIEIPNTVIEIENGTFDDCNELNGVKCSPNHFMFLNKKQIKTLILNQEVDSINDVDFNEFVNLESITIPNSIQDIDGEKFVNCKKLINVDHPRGNSLINNSISIDENKNEILKSDFEGWTNLEKLVIPKSIQNIEEGTFNDCVNLKQLTCDPKWFPYIPKNSIRKVIIPDFVEEIKKGQFDDFYSMTYIKLPRYIIINDETIFDSCESLKIIKCKSSVFSKLSDKTIERCDQKLKTKYENPIFNFQPDPSKVFDETNLKENDLIDDSLSQSLTNSLFLSMSSRISGLGTTIDELIAYEPDANNYRCYIENVLKLIHSHEVTEPTQFNDSSIPEISIICGFICNKISKRPLNITINIVQIYAILRLANDILNNNNKDGCKGSVAEIKPGEGKTLIITILAIICVKYGHTVDVVSSNLQCAKRDQKEHKAIFDLFNVPSSVFYDRRSDSDLITRSTNFTNPDYFNQYKEYDKSEFDKFNLKAFECPVVYSTNRNFEYYHLHTMYSLIPRKRDLDVVLINDVDNMLIDELDSAAVISKEINYAQFHDILERIYSNRFIRISEIAKILHALFPDMSDFNEDDIDLIKDAALEADNKIKDIDYAIIDNKVVIIDHDSGFKMPNSHWPIYVREMVEIKEKKNNKNIELSQPSLIMCQLTQQTYFKLYNKIAAVTDTFGSPTDEEVLKEGYNLNTFKVPRNILTKIEVYYKNRPESIEEIFDLVNEEIISKIEENRPVLVIWDSKYNAESFMKSHDLGRVGVVFGQNQLDDELGIDSAGEPRSITMTNSVVCKNIDIKPTRESLEAGGLHVIIPMKISNLRSFEQAVGTTGKHGQPGSVTILISNKDLYIKTPSFNKRNDNLVRLQNMFVEHIKKDYSWMLCGPGKRKISGTLEFPFIAHYTDVLGIFSLFLCFTIYEEIKKSTDQSQLMNDYQDLVLILVQTVWSSFFTKMKTDKLNSDNWTYCEKAYVRFLKEFHKYFQLEKCKTAESSLDDFRDVFDAISGHQYLIFGKRYKISSSDVKLIATNDIEYVKKQYAELTKNDNKGKLSLIFEKFLMNFIVIPGNRLLYKSPKVDIKHFDIEFIRFNMILAKEAYDGGKFSIGNVVLASDKNEVFKPKFYCVEFFNKIFIVTRGSSSDDDWVTDFMFDEILETFDGIDIYFHKGFYTAARYILSNVAEIIERDYDEIYFVGHSYAAAVSNVLCLLTKMHKSFKDKKIYSFAFAPPPSMSKIPGHIQECMFSFINKTDIVPHLSLNNLKGTFDFTDKDTRELFTNTIKFILAIKTEYAKKLATYTKKYQEKIISVLQNIAGQFRVHKNIGNIFLIGVSDTTKLKNCQIDETDLQDSIFVNVKPHLLPFNIEATMFDDHFMTEYIKSFSIIKSYD